MPAGLPLSQAALLPKPRKPPLVLSGVDHLLGCAAFVGHESIEIGQLV